MRTSTRDERSQYWELVRLTSFRVGVCLLSGMVSGLCATAAFAHGAPVSGAIGMAAMLVCFVLMVRFAAEKVRPRTAYLTCAACVAVALVLALI